MKEKKGETVTMVAMRVQLMERRRKRTVVRKEQFVGQSKDEELEWK
jgi:hypothetical protein